MYTILVNQDNTMTTSVRERIMQRSKLVDSLHFLVDPIYKGLDMSDFTVTMEYILPVSKKYITEILVKSNEPYNSKINKEMLEYTLPFDTKLTREPGDIKVQLTFTKVDLDEYGNNRQYVRKISETTIHITPISAWSDIIPDEALNAIDQRIIKTDAQIKALEELNEVTAITKADNIKLDEETNDIYLTANGEKIGDSINLSDLGTTLAENTKDGLIKMII